MAQEIVCGPEKKKHLDNIQKMMDAGFEQVYVHQMGPGRVVPVLPEGNTT